MLHSANQWAVICRMLISSKYFYFTANYAVIYFNISFQLGILEIVFYSCTQHEGWFNSLDFIIGKRLEIVHLT